METLGPELDKHINALANAIYDLLQPFEGGKRIFILSAAIQLCNRRLQSRESSQFRLDLTRDKFPSEPPTVPDHARPDVGDRETRRVNVAEIADDIAKSRKKI